MAGSGLRDEPEISRIRNRLLAILPLCSVLNSKIKRKVTKQTGNEEM